MQLSNLRRRYLASKQAGHLETALRTLQIIEKFVPDPPNTKDERLFAAWFYEELGGIYRDLGEAVLAIAAFEQAMKADPFSHVESDLARLKLGIAPNEEFFRVLEIPEDPF